MKFSELQQLLKHNYGIEHLADIARELGVSPQAVSNWKSRDRVPYKYVLKIRRQLEESGAQVNGQREENVSDSNEVSTQYSYPQYFEEDTISFMDILLIMVKQLRIIFIMPIIFCILAIIHVQFRVQPVYESSAKIISSSGGGASQAAGIAATFGISIPQSAPHWMYPEIVKSHTFAVRMLKRRFDTEKYGSQKTLLQILTYGDQHPTVGLDTLILDGVDAVKGMINLQNKGSFYILTISAPEPKFARDFASVLIEELDAHESEYNKSKASEGRQFIEERIVSTEKELRVAEETLMDFRDRNRRIENSPSLQLDMDRHSREVGVLIGVYTTRKQQLETTKIEEVKESSYVVVLDPPQIPLRRSRPKKKRMVLLAGSIGIFFGVIIGFIKEYVETSS